MNWTTSSLRKSQLNWKWSLLFYSSSLNTHFRVQYWKNKKSIKIKKLNSLCWKFIFLGYRSIPHFGISPIVILYLHNFAPFFHHCFSGFFMVDEDLLVKEYYKGHTSTEMNISASWEFSIWSMESEGYLWITNLYWCMKHRIPLIDQLFDHKLHRRLTQYL